VRDLVAGSSFVDAEITLAERVLTALDRGSEVGVADLVDRCADLTATLGAVRLVGADLFAPQLLDNLPLNQRDIDVVAESFRVFPPVEVPVTHEQRVRAWRDWATRRVVDHLTGLTERVPPPDTVVLTEAGGWTRWSARVAQLSSLALPQVGGPLVDAVAGQGVSLARGATRAVLRGDHTTAARLNRWIALLVSMGVSVPLDPVLLSDHVNFRGGTGPRLLLDLAIARRLLGREPS
jgi:hypothetical protein